MSKKHTEKKETLADVRTIVSTAVKVCQDFDKACESYDKAKEARAAVRKRLASEHGKAYKMFCRIKGLTQGEFASVRAFNKFVKPLYRKVYTEATCRKRLSELRAMAGLPADPNKVHKKPVKKTPPKKDGTPDNAKHAPCMLAQIVTGYSKTEKTEFFRLLLSDKSAEKTRDIFGTVCAEIDENEHVENAAG